MAREQIPPIDATELDYALPSNIEIPHDLDTEAVCRELVLKLDEACSKNDWTFVETHFREESFLRDQIALTATLRTFRGRAKVGHALAALAPRAQTSDFQLVLGSSEVVRPPVPGLAWVQALYTFKTGSPAAFCSGSFRLLPTSDPDVPWQFWTLSSTVESLVGHVYRNPVENSIGDWKNGAGAHTLATGHINGHINGHSNGHSNGNINGESDDHTERVYDVVVIGAGQNGVQLAARLRGMGISVLVVDKNAAAGDSWKLRYDLLCLHTPKAYGHPAYLPYPDDVPQWVPTARVAEQYRLLAERAGVHVQTSSEVYRADFDDKTNKWTISIKPSHPDTQQENGSPATVESTRVQSAFLVFAAGAGSQKPSMPNFPGQEDYQGEIVHSSQYMNGKRWAGKSAIVIGTANSGHDMAQDLYLTGAKDITIVQREKTFIIPREYLAGILSAGYNSSTPSEVSDRFAFGTPLAVTRALVMRIQHDLIRKNAKRFDDLEAKGFKVLRYGDLFAHTLGRGGGHYVDIGCSELIASGKIKVKSNNPITGFTKTGLEFKDGSTVDADLVLFATGFRDKNLRLQAEEIVGSKITDNMDDVWGLNKEGEVRGTWRATGHPRFIIMAGDVAISRYYSHVAAIQIQETLLGVNVPPYMD